MSEELDLDALMAEAQSAAAEADRVVRTLEERRRAVFEVVEASTPQREVRTPAERRAAVQRVLEERQRQIEARRRSNGSLAAPAPPAPDPRPSPALPLSFPEHPPEVEAVVEAARRDRKPRTQAQRLEDARRAAIDELERRRQATADRHQTRS